MTILTSLSKQFKSASVNQICRSDAVTLKNVGNEQIMASLNIVYRHKPKLMAELIKVQHTSEAHVISTVHIHISRTHCLEVITVKGSKESILRLANKVSGISGIEYAKLFTFSLPEDDTEHEHVH